MTRRAPTAEEAKTYEVMTVCDGNYSYPSHRRDCAFDSLQSARDGLGVMLAEDPSLSDYARIVAVREDGTIAFEVRG